VHESLLAEEILAVALVEAGKRGATSVTRLRLRLGVLEGLSPEGLRVAFEERARGTIAEAASLAIERVPGLAVCTECGERVALEAPESSHGAPAVGPCPACGGRVRITEGTGWTLESVRVVA
jgi:hydrogenase nickel incorporation protein HypA/HybF